MLSRGQSVDRVPSLPPEMAAGFDIGAAVGRGAAGVVYRGREKALGGAPVAIKAVATRSMARAQQDQLLQEIGTLKKCSHANIVALKNFYGSASTAQVFIVMEWCGEGDLERFIMRCGSQLPGGGALRVIQEHVALHFMRQLAAALRFLRSIDVVHGDLKPANLLLTKSPAAGGAGASVPQLKVGDFGLAQSLRGDESSSRLHGTALYLAPELVISRSFSAGCDLWSSGAILHRMLYGWPAVHPPGPEQNDLDSALRRIAALGSEHNRDQPQALPSSPAPLTVSDSCQDLLLKLLQPRPEQRISFGLLWGHPCINLPSQEAADSAATSAEELAAAAYAGLGTDHTGARLVAAKNAFLDAGHRYLALERDSGSGMLPEDARQCAFAMVRRAEELSDAAMQVGYVQPEPEPEPEPELAPEHSREGDREMRLSQTSSSGRYSLSATCSPAMTSIGATANQVATVPAAVPALHQQQRLALTAQIAAKAVAADSTGHMENARNLYVEVLERVASMEMDGQIDPALLQSSGLRVQFAEYAARVAELEKQLQPTNGLHLESSARSSGASDASCARSDADAAGVSLTGSSISANSNASDLDRDGQYNSTCGIQPSTTRHVCSSACERPCQFDA